MVLLLQLLRLTTLMVLQVTFRRQLDAITTSLDGLTFDVLTQAAYDALTPDANTIYFIVG
jgi:hypothetical protein